MTPRFLTVTSLPADRGEWGGLIILGNATIANSDPTDNIEGIAATEASRSLTVVTTDDDNSGVLTLRFYPSRWCSAFC
jgi:hypothetical protein